MLESMCRLHIEALAYETPSFAMGALFILPPCWSTFAYNCLCRTLQYATSRRPVHTSPDYAMVRASAHWTALLHLAGLGDSTLDLNQEGRKSNTSEVLPAAQAARKAKA
jgi:hypothetical protein